MKRSLLLLSFFEGGAVMCAELCGARLLAPFFGGSLYVWASVMGITLGALAAGYFFGGWYSGAGSRERRLRLLLVLAALYLLLMPLLAAYLLPLLSYLPFLPALMISTLLLLMPPVFFLGATSPLFIAIQTGEKTAAGMVSGTVYAVSTAGGIFSTFLCGFLLIPLSGLSTTLLLHGSVLLLFTFLTLRGKIMLPVLAAILVMSVNNTRPENSQNLFLTDGINGRIEVRELTENGLKLRRLLVNGIIQSEMNAVTGENTTAYIKLLDSLVQPAEQSREALVLGAGAGIAANLLVQKGYHCTAVEFDPRIIKAAKTFFGAHPSIDFVNEDARRFLNQNTTLYDLVLVDVFKSEEQPSHILTVQSLSHLHASLQPGAVIYVNWHGYEKGPLAAGTDVLRNTFLSAGYTMEQHQTGTDPHYRNTIFLVKSSGETPPLSSFSLVNTDDRPLLEWSNAAANIAWRRNYLKYYHAFR